MDSRGSTLKLTAVLALVVLTMTGFSSGRHGHGRSSSGGGGCSSSSQNHGGSSTSSGSTSGSSSSDSYRSGDDDSAYGSSDSGGGSGYTRRPSHRSTPTSSSTGSSTTLKAGTAKLISCATASTPYATVEITNPNKRKADFQAWVTFYDAEGTLLLRTQSVMVTVPAKAKANTHVKLGKRFLASVDLCQVDQQVEPAN
ncbi:hypothetical protein OG985_43300 [Streptomyces sp. NBC_00289]|uniref:hypothetical protein n=1 Tax=Streptomyces sp. NBC_00289 TaxID=2975703 RepID=UPI00324C2203